MTIEVSVIVPTRNRKDSLLQLLKSLLEQTLAPERYEIVVVSDGSTDGSREMIRALQTEHANLFLVDGEKRGPAAARNAGARTARGTYLAFTDDDCIASRDWLERLVQAFELGSAVGVQGRTSTDRSACTPITEQMEIFSEVFYVPTCNAGYRREVFERVGGFDESFPFPHHEDTDLAWRVQKVGKIEFASDVRVMHPPRKTTISRRASGVRFLESDFLLFTKHPALYRRWCSRSPWVTIYYRTFIFGGVIGLKASLRYLIRSFKLRCFVQGIGLTLMRGWNLIRFYPYYLKAARQCGSRGVDR